MLRIEEIPIPQPLAGWVLIRVKAFGLNRSELFTRQGHCLEWSREPILSKRCSKVAIEAWKMDPRTVCAKSGQMDRETVGPTEVCPSR